MERVRIDFPCFAVLSDDCRLPVMLQSTTGGEIGIAIFTTEDRLRAYRQLTGKLWPVIRFDWAGQIVLYADALAANIAGLWVDPTSDNKGVFVAMAEIMAYFQRTEAPQ